MCIGYLWWVFSVWSQNHSIDTQIILWMADLYLHILSYLFNGICVSNVNIYCLAFVSSNPTSKLTHIVWNQLKIVLKKQTINCKQCEKKTEEKNIIRRSIIKWNSKPMKNMHITAYSFSFYVWNKWHNANNTWKNERV